MSVVKKFKLYRIKTVIFYLVSSWKHSSFIIEQAPEKKRFLIYLDLIYSFLRYGADFNDYCTFSFWNKSNIGKDSFITLRRNDQLRFAFSTPKVYSLFLDKDLFNECFYKWVRRGWISSKRSSTDEILAFIEKYDEVIAKPLSDYGGHGVIKISKGEIDRKDKIDSIINCIQSGKGYIVEEVIENCDNIRRLAPASLNTVRIVTVIDKEGRMNVLASLLRMGNGRAVTDNYHDGGMACEIDLETMKLKGNAKGMNCVSYDTHPFSKIVFDGYSVPEVKQCLEILEKVVFTEPDARYVGWDFAITRTGNVELIEGNIPPGEDITQLNCQRGFWYEMLRWQ